MAVFYRRLQRVGFQAAIFTSKWTCSKPPFPHVRSYLSATAPVCFKEANQTKLGHHKSSFASYTKDITDHVNKIEACSSDNIYPLDLPYIDHEKQSRKERKIFYPAIESSSAKVDFRAFQQCRPEYKSMCYNSECFIKTSVEEGYIIIEKITDNLTPSEVSEFLVQLSYLPGEVMKELRLDAKLQTLCSLSTSHIHLFTNSELISCLGAYARLGISQTPHMLKIYEQELCLRVQQLSTDELLLAADTFIYIGCPVPGFLDAIYSSMQLRCVDLSLPQVIQLVYIIGRGRHAPPDLLKKMDKLVWKHLEDINLEEIGTVCFGFYKTKNGLSAKVMFKFEQFVAKNIEQMSNLSLVNLLKMFRFTRVVHMPFFKRVGQDVCKRIPGMSVHHIMHVVLTFATMHILDEDLMNTVALAIPDRLSYCRSKDLAKFLWCFGILRFTPQNSDVFYSAFINQIRNNLEEFEIYPEHFLTCLVGLAFCQQFPFDLINIALSDKFVMQSSKKGFHGLRNDILTIASTVEIECPQYTGNTISQEYRKEITDTLGELSTQKIYTRRDVIAMWLEQVFGGPEYVKEHMILPHFNSKDLEVHLDVNRKPIAINSVSKEHDQYFVKSNNIWNTDSLLNPLTNASTRTPDTSKNIAIENPENLNIVGGLPVKTCSEERSEHLTWQSEVIKLAIQVTRHHDYLYNSQQLTGFHAMKQRQLRKLGYVVVEVPPWEWFPLLKNDLLSQLDYMHHKVFSAV